MPSPVPTGSEASLEGDEADRDVIAPDESNRAAYEAVYADYRRLAEFEAAPR